MPFGVRLARRTAALGSHILCGLHVELADGASRRRRGGPTRRSPRISVIDGDDVDPALFMQAVDQVVGTADVGPRIVDLGGNEPGAVLGPPPLGALAIEPAPAAQVATNGVDG